MENEKIEYLIQPMSPKRMSANECTIINKIISVISVDTTGKIPDWYPLSYKEIGDLCGLSEKTVQRIISNEKSKIHKVILVSEPTDKKKDDDQYCRLSYQINFTMINILNENEKEDRKSKIIHTSKQHGEETEQQMLERLNQEARTRMQKANERKKEFELF